LLQAGRRSAFRIQCQFIDRNRSLDRIGCRSVEAEDQLRKVGGRQAQLVERNFDERPLRPDRVDDVRLALLGGAAKGHQPRRKSDPLTSVAADNEAERPVTRSVDAQKPDTRFGGGFALAQPVIDFESAASLKSACLIEFGRAVLRSGKALARNPEGVITIEARNDHRIRGRRNDRSARCVRRFVRTPPRGRPAQAAAEPCPNGKQQEPWDEIAENPERRPWFARRDGLLRLRPGWRVEESVLVVGEHGDDLLHRLITVLAIFCHHALNDVAQIQVEMRIALTRIRNVVGQMLRGDDRRRIVLVGSLSGHQLVQSDAERVDVGSRVDVAGVLQALRRDVGRTSDDPAPLGHRPVHSNPLGKPHVGDLDRAVLGEDEVFRLDVAVDDLAAVRVRERRGGLSRVSDGIDHRKFSPLPPDGEQVAAVDVFHDEIVNLVALRARLVHGHDVGVVELGSGAGLAQKELQIGRVVNPRRREKLDGNQAVERQVSAQIDDAHAPDPDFADDGVAGQGSAHPRVGLVFAFTGERVVSGHRLYR